METEKLEVEEEPTEDILKEDNLETEDELHKEITS